MKAKQAKAQPTLKCQQQGLRLVELGQSAGQVALTLNMPQ